MGEMIPIDCMLLPPRRLHGLIRAPFPPSLADSAWLPREQKRRRLPALAWLNFPGRLRVTVLLHAVARGTADAEDALRITQQAPARRPEHHARQPDCRHDRGGFGNCRDREGRTSPARRGEALIEGEVGPRIRSGGRRRNKGTDV